MLLTGVHATGEVHLEINFSGNLFITLLKNTLKSPIYVFPHLISEYMHAHSIVEDLNNKETRYKLKSMSKSSFVKIQHLLKKYFDIEIILATDTRGRNYLDVLTREAAADENQSLEFSYLDSGTQRIIAFVVDLTTKIIEFCEKWAHLQKHSNINATLLYFSIDEVDNGISVSSLSSFYDAIKELPNLFELEINPLVVFGSHAVELIPKLTEFNAHLLKDPNTITKISDNMSFLNDVLPHLTTSYDMVRLTRAKAIIFVENNSSDVINNDTVTYLAWIKRIYGEKITQVVKRDVAFIGLNGRANLDKIVLFLKAIEDVIHWNPIILTIFDSDLQPREQKVYETVDFGNYTLLYTLKRRSLENYFFSPGAISKSINGVVSRKEASHILYRIAEEYSAEVIESYLRIQQAAYLSMKNLKHSKNSKKFETPYKIAAEKSVQFLNSVPAKHLNDNNTQTLNPKWVYFILDRIQPHVGMQAIESKLNEVISKLKSKIEKSSKKSKSKSSSSSSQSVDNNQNNNTNKNNNNNNNNNTNNGGNTPILQRRTSSSALSPYNLKPIKLYHPSIIQSFPDKYIPRDIKRLTSVILRCIKHPDAKLEYVKSYVNEVEGILEEYSNWNFVTSRRGTYNNTRPVLSSAQIAASTSETYKLKSFLNYLHDPNKNPTVKLSTTHTGSPFPSPNISPTSPTDFGSHRELDSSPVIFSSAPNAVLTTALKHIEVNNSPKLFSAPPLSSSPLSSTSTLSATSSQKHSNNNGSSTSTPNNPAMTLLKPQELTDSEAVERTSINVEPPSGENTPQLQFSGQNSFISERFNMNSDISDFESKFDEEGTTSGSDSISHAPDAQFIVEKNNSDSEVFEGVYSEIDINAVPPKDSIDEYVQLELEDQFNTIKNVTYSGDIPNALMAILDKTTTAVKNVKQADALIVGLNFSQKKVKQARHYKLTVMNVEQAQKRFN